MMDKRKKAVMAEKTKTRVVRTPQERAEEEVDVLIRRVNRLEGTKAKIERSAAALDPEIQAARERLVYAKANPDLKAPVVNPYIADGDTAGAHDDLP